jgi:hypothetical protein
MTPAGFPITYALATSTILAAVRLNRRRFDFWPSGVPRQLVGAEPAQFTQDEAR